MACCHCFIGSCSVAVWGRFSRDFPTLTGRRAIQICGARALLSAVRFFSVLLCERVPRKINNSTKGMNRPSKCMGQQCHRQFFSIANTPSHPFVEKAARGHFIFDGELLRFSNYFQKYEQARLACITVCSWSFSKIHPFNYYINMFGFSLEPFIILKTSATETLVYILKRSNITVFLSNLFVIFRNIYFSWSKSYYNFFDINNLLYM